MKSVLDKSTRDELISRINQLDKSNTAQWGKMNVSQMIKHCVMCEELFLGRIKHKRSFMGRLFGKVGLRNILSEGKSFPKNAPTSDAFKVKDDSGDMEAEKKKWTELIEEYQSYPNSYVHWFFGRMNREQVGQFVYKHDDHHLQQFGV